MKLILAIYCNNCSKEIFLFVNLKSRNHHSMIFSYRKWGKPMNKFWTVLGHTYFSKLKAKSFLITTAIAIIVIIGIANADKLVDLFSGDEETEIAVIDETDQLMDPLQQSVNEVEGSFKLKAYDDSVADGKQAVEDETYDGLLVLEWNAEEEPEAIYYQNDATESQEEMIVN